MVYKDGQTGIDFANKTEWFDFQIDRNLVILQGEHVPSFVKRVTERINTETDTGKQSKLRALLDRIEQEQ